MGWLGNLFGGKPTNYARLDGDGDYLCDVVGESHYQAALNRIAGGKTEDGHQIECTAILVPEPTNSHDRNAVKVMIAGAQVGYLSRTHAAALSTVFQKRRLAGAEVDAMITGC